MFAATAAEIPLIRIVVVPGTMIETKNEVALTKSAAMKAEIELEQKISRIEITRLKKKKLGCDAVRKDPEKMLTI